MQRSKRASVEAQINLQPFLLGGGSSNSITNNDSSRNSGNNMSQPSESGSTRSSKRDSGFSDIVGSFPITTANLRRISLKKQTQMEQFAAQPEATSPIYRLYPHISNNGSRRLRAMSDRSAIADANTPTAAAANENDVTVRQSASERAQTSADTTIYAPIAQRHIQQIHHTGEDNDDDVFELDSSSPATASKDFADTFVLPPSRAESHDSFATPPSGNSRASTPVNDDFEHVSVPAEDQEVAGHDHSVLQEPSFPSAIEDLDVQPEQEQHHTPSQAPAANDQQQDLAEQPQQGTRVLHSSRNQSMSSRHLREHSSQEQLQHSRDSSLNNRHLRERSIQGRHTPSLPDLTAHTKQSLSSARELSPIRGRQPIEVYKPKGLRLSDRASNASLNSFRLSSRASMGFLKVSSTGEIADFDDNAPNSPETMMYGAGDRSSAESVLSQDTNATSLTNLPPLQSKGPDYGDAQLLEPLLEDDPRSFDLVDPPAADEPRGVYALEERADLMFSQRHLQGIFDDSRLLMKFTSFLNLHRPQSIPLLIYYLDALKAMRAIQYANAIAEALEPITGQEFTKDAPKLTVNAALEQKAREAFKLLTEEDLPAYIAYIWIQVVSTSIQRRITGTLAPHLREASEGLAETFCLSDPSRKDNPIVFCSEEFARTTQYGMTYAIGRNCRFLQGPRTSPASIRRLAAACRAGIECNEVFVNYRRDGSPFLNLLMIAPLMDSKGVVRYYIGAQVDVSGLLKGCSELPALADLVDEEEEGGKPRRQGDERDEFRELTEMFNGAELDIVRKYGGRMHKEYVDDSDVESLADRRPRMVLKDSSQDILLDEVEKQRESSVPAAIREKINGKLEGVYQHYLLVRPAPSLRILFTSPSLRVPGILQSPFLHRIGGSARVRNDLSTALAEGRGVTAKIRWLLKADEDGEGEGRSRWIHCTPLLGHSGAVGVWMVVLVEDEGHQQSGSGTPRRFRQAPPVAEVINGRDWDGERSQRQRHAAGYARDFDTPRQVATPVPGASSSTSKTHSSSNSQRGNTTTNITTERTQPTIRNLSSSSSAIGQALSAPSPDIPDKRVGRNASTVVDFANPGSRASSSASHRQTLVDHVNRLRSRSRGNNKNSSASAFSLDLR